MAAGGEGQKEAAVCYANRAYCGEARECREREGMKQGCETCELDVLIPCVSYDGYEWLGWRPCPKEFVGTNIGRTGDSAPAGRQYLPAGAFLTSQFRR